MIFRQLISALLAFCIPFGLAASANANSRYAWHQAAQPAARTLAQLIPPPSGFRRVAAAPGSWADWLRGLPMKPAGAAVLTYTGARKWRQDVHVAVVDIDIGDRDLQQCADAIMRLRAEWLYGSGRAEEIAFNYTDGTRHALPAETRGKYPAFRRYMNKVFAYAGTYSLSRELKPATGNIQIGDVFIKGGFPGHAVLVADLVENASGEKRFLLLQSYMPAQDIHVLKNPADADAGPWYSASFTGDLATPEWVFAAGSRKRWP